MGKECGYCKKNHKNAIKKSNIEYDKSLNADAKL